MTIFTSGTQALQGRTVNHDPEPYLWFSGGRSAKGSDWGSRPQCRYAPRPEYAVLDNPLLGALRDCKRFCPEDCEDALAWVEWLWQEDRAEGDQPAHIDHARRVLTRLAALTR